MEVVQQLLAAISAVCPVESVAIGRLSDKSTWRVDFLPEATKPQKMAARDAVIAFDTQAAIQAKQAADNRQRKAANLIDILIRKGLLSEADLA